MYKCLDCGHIFEYGEWKCIVAPHGEEFSVCPICEGSFQETITCKRCGTQIFEEEAFHGLCECCVDDVVDDYRYDFDKCAKISTSAAAQPVKVSALLSCLLDEGDINQILTEFIKERFGDRIDCFEFIDADTDWFFSQLERRGEL